MMKDLPIIGQKKEKKGVRPPVMTIAEATHTTLVLKEFVKSDHFKNVPEHIREPIQSSLKKFEGLFEKKKK